MTFSFTDGSGKVITIDSSDCVMKPEAFERTYWSMVSCSKTYNEAYEKAEDIHERIFNKRRYSGYASFQNSIKK